MFHVEHMKKYKNYYCTSKDTIVTGELFSVYFNDNFTVAKTKIPLDEDMYRFYSTDNYQSYKIENKKFTDKVYSFARQVMAYYKYKIITKQTSTKRVLDYGCGSGHFLNYISLRGIEAMGIEKSNVAKKICLDKGLKVFSSIKGLSETKFDVVSLWHVLEHTSSPVKTISTLSTFLSPNGRFVVAVPNIQSIDSQVFKSEWAGLDVPRHIWHFTPKGLINLFKKEGFVLIEKRALILDAYYISLLSAKRRKFWMPWILSLFVGTLSNIIAIFTGNFSSNIFVFKKA